MPTTKERKRETGYSRAVGTGCGSHEIGGQALGYLHCSEVKNQLVQSRGDYVQSVRRVMAVVGLEVDQARGWHSSYLRITMHWIRCAYRHRQLGLSL